MTFTLKKELAKKMYNGKKIHKTWQLIFWALWWRPTRLQHLLHNVETNSSSRFILCNCQVIKHVKVAKVWGKRVSVLISQPFPFSGVCMPCANVFGLKMLQLTVNIVPVTHGGRGYCWIQMIFFQSRQSKILS